LWCLCARLIQKQLVRTHATTFDLKSWETLLSSGDIVRSFRGYASTASVITEFLKTDQPKTMKKKLLELLSNQPESFKLDITHQDTIFLASSGLIIPCDPIENGIFTLGPPALQACVLLGISKAYKTPPQILPPMANNQLDVLETLCIALKLVDRDHLRSAYMYATKASEITPITGTSAVLKEAVYSIELVSVLRAWLPLDIDITPEVNCDSKRADILISSENPPFKVVIELLANERYDPKSRRSSMLGHITRAKLYADSLGTTAWVIHFIGVEKFPPKNDFPDSPDCCCVYVYHFHDLTKMKIAAKLTDKSIKVVEI